MDCRKITGLVKNNPETLIASEVFLHRNKKTLSKKMRANWAKILTVEHFTEIGCWATLKEMQEVIPYHGERFAQVILMSSRDDANVPSQLTRICDVF